MPRTRTVLLASVLAALWAGWARAQTPTPTPPPTTIPVGTTFTTENSRAVTGVRIETAPDGAVWFLTPSNDRIVRLAGGTMTQWQIRTDNQVGANPVDFELDGELVWFVETGESQIDAGRSVFGRLNTATGELREWVLPSSRPAGFYRAPDGRVWIPQSSGLLQSLDLDDLALAEYRSNPPTFASDIAVGPDGAFFLSDFGNNRIVRWRPGDPTLTSWTLLDPQSGLRLNPSQIAFDAAGLLWICELSGNRMERLDPATGELRTYGGLASPIHFEISGGRLYVTEAPGGNGRVVVLDPGVAVSVTSTITPLTFDMSVFDTNRRVTIRDSVVQPTTFTPVQTPIPAADLKISSSGPGILRLEFPSRNGYGIDFAGGVLWVGSDGKLARIVPQTLGSPSDQSVPVAIQSVGPFPARIRIDLTLFNRGTVPISGDALYLPSPVSFSAPVPFTVDPGETLLVEDAFGSNTGLVGSLQIGPVRLRIQSGDAADLVATVRSSRVTGSSSFGIAVPAAAVTRLGPGENRTLFMGARASEHSVFGFFSPGGAEGTATLVSSSGEVRGTLRLSLVSNVAEEFNPAAAAFGVEARPGDVIRLRVDSGSLQAYVNVLDPASGDLAISLPVEPSLESFFPNAGTGVGAGGVLFVSDLFLSNPDAAGAARVTLRLTPLGATTPLPAVEVILPPGGSRTIPDLVSAAFGLAQGQGALVVTSDRPVAASLRMAARRGEGDFAGFAQGIDAGELVGEGGAVAIDVSQTGDRRTNLLLFNAGAAGTVTVTGYDASGSPVGEILLPLAAGEAGRINSVFLAMGAGPRRTGRLRVQASPGMRLYAQTVEIDRATGDPDPSPLR